MQLVSLAPRANNYLIQIIAQNNVAHVETCTIEGTYTRTTTSVAKLPYTKINLVR